MSAEQIGVLIAAVAALVGGGRVVGRYVWGKFTAYVDGLEQKVTKLEGELTALKGAPATAEAPAIEGVIPGLQRQFTTISDDNEQLTEKVDRLETAQVRLTQERDGAWMALDEEMVIRQQAERDRDTIAGQLSEALESIKSQQRQNTEDIQQLKDTHKTEIEKAHQETADERAKRIKAEQENTGLKQEVDRLERRIDELETQVNKRLEPLENDRKGDTGPLPSIE